MSDVYWDVEWTPETSPDDMKRISALLGGHARGRTQIGFYVRNDAQEALADELIAAHPNVVSYAKTPTEAEQCRVTLRSTRAELRTISESPSDEIVPCPPCDAGPALECPSADPPECSNRWWAYVILGVVIAQTFSIAFRARMRCY
jgi:hypothetical protein